jgi:hypothetical protein
MYETLILSLVSYGNEIWFQVVGRTQTGVLEVKFEPETEEEIRQWRKLYNEKLHSWYPWYISLG